MTDENAMVLAVDRESPAELMRSATVQAEALADLIKKKGLTSRIQGRDYVRVEGWVPLARMQGVIPREISVEDMGDGRYVAVVALVRLSDGVELTRASSECGDEPMWAERPRYARRSMAITRATGKACRLAYSWIMSLAGYEPTPAEEMESLGRENTADKIEPPRRASQVKNGDQEWRGYIVEVEKPVSGQSSSGPWRFWPVVCKGLDGTMEKFSTFSDTDADLAAAFRSSGEPCLIHWRTSKKGNKEMRSIEECNPEIET